jgi:hypothetical protein
MADPVLLEGVPSTAELIELRRIMGSPYVDQEAASKTVSGALFKVCLRQEGRLVGLARVVGDGVLYFYVSDVIVRPELGGGVRRAAHEGGAGLFEKGGTPRRDVVVPLKGRETFYERFGFNDAATGASESQCISPSRLKLERESE